MTLSNQVPTSAVTLEQLLTDPYPHYRDMRNLAPVVWVPAGLYLLLTGRVVAGLVLVGWCAAVLATVEYVVRPALVGTDIKMPDLLVLVGTLGGLYLFGPIGFIVGPIVCGLFLTVWQIYRETFRSSATSEK